MIEHRAAIEAAQLRHHVRLQVAILPQVDLLPFIGKMRAYPGRADRNRGGLSLHALPANQAKTAPIYHGVILEEPANAQLHVIRNRYGNAAGKREILPAPINAVRKRLAASEGDVAFYGGDAARAGNGTGEIRRADLGALGLIPAVGYWRPAFLRRQCAGRLGAAKQLNTHLPGAPVGLDSLDLKISVEVAVDSLAGVVLHLVQYDADDVAHFQVILIRGERERQPKRRAGVSIPEAVENPLDCGIGDPGTGQAAKLQLFLVRLAVLGDGVGVEQNINPGEAASLQAVIPDHNDLVNHGTHVVGEIGVAGHVCGVELTNKAAPGHDRGHSAQANLAIRVDRGVAPHHSENLLLDELLAVRAIQAEELGGQADIEVIQIPEILTDANVLTGADVLGGDPKVPVVRQVLAGIAVNGTGQQSIGQHRGRHFQVNELLHLGGVVLI